MHIRRPLCVLCVLYAVILFIFATLNPPHPSINTKEFENTYLTVSGTITGKITKNNKIYLKIEGCRIFTSDNTDYPCGIMQAVLSPEKYPFAFVKIGQKIKLGGKFHEYPSPTCEGEFNSRKYYSIRHIDGSVNNCNIIMLSKSYDAFGEILCQISEKASQILSDNLSKEDYGVLNALMLGKKQDLDTEIKDAYERAGISHILSLSGLHIATVGICLIKLLKRCALPSLISSIVASMLMVCYALMTGLSTSTLRALIMFIIASTAEVVQRTYDMKSAASLSCIAILLENPYYIIDTGFQLSFGAIVGISFICPAISMMIQKSHVLFYRKMRLVIDPLVLSLGICLATLPISASSFYKISRYGFILNLLVIPLMSFVLFFGLAGLISGYIACVLFAGDMTVPATILEFMRDTCFSVTHVFLSFYRLSSSFISNLSGNTLVCGKPSAMQVTAYYFLIFVAILWINIKYVRQTDGLPFDLSSQRFVLSNNCSYVKMHNKITLFLNPTNAHIIRFLSHQQLYIVLLLILSVVILTNKPAPDFQICNFSVGQGDCALVFAKESPDILIDGGSTSEKQAGRYKLIPSLLSKGISHLDYVFISHLDEDHVSCIFEILNDPSCGIKIDRIILSEYCVISGRHSSIMNYEKLCNLCKKENVSLLTISQGQNIELGRVKIACLWPNAGTVPKKEASYEAYDANEASMVLKIIDKSTGLSALFTGDIGSDAEEEILKYAHKESVPLNCNYLKVAHHGSKESSSEEFLEAVMPDIAVISVGKRNTYGHPHKEVIERLNAQNVKTLRTDYDKEIILTTTGNKLQIKTLAALYAKSFGE